MRNLALNYFLSKSVLLIFLIGLFLSVSAYIFSNETIINTQKKEFHHIVQKQSDAIQRELHLNFEILDSVKRFYTSSDDVNRDDFRNFVSGPLEEYKSIQALEWIPRVTYNERINYEKRASDELNNVFSIKQKSQTGQMVSSPKKSEYFPVYYLEPLKGNEKALGFDLSSSQVRLNSLNKSKSINAQVATAKIKLVQEKSEQYGFLVFDPVFKENRKDLMGFVLGVYRVTDMVSHALSYNMNESKESIIWLADITQDKQKPDLLFTNATKKEEFSQYQSIELNIKGRIWKIYAKPSQIFVDKYSSQAPYIILFVMLFVTIMMAYIVALRISREDDLKKLVEEKTKDLSIANEKYLSLLEMFDKKVIASKTDIKGKITYVSEAFCKISGYKKEELMGQNHNIVRHLDMPKSLYENLWTTIQSGKVFTGDIKNRRKDGSYYWVDVQIEPEFDTENNIIGYSAIREDITAKKQIEEFNKTLANKIEEAVIENSKKDKLLLEQSKLAAMGEMIGAIAHQWRQPLNTLAIKVQFLEDDFEDNLINEEYLKEYSIESMKLVNFMSKTIDDFRNFFTIDKEKVNFSIKTKILETTDILITQLESHNIEVSIKGEDFSIRGYPSEFQQVILNILNNAKDAILENSIDNATIQIHIESKDNCNRVTIKDSAGGIPKEVIERIFEPYFTTKEQGKGTGLGLYMSKMIIEDNMSGQLKVENIDDGALFTIELEKNLNA